MSKNICILSSTINGNINAPASKSYSQRACAAALLVNGRTIITNYGNSNDEKVAIEIIKQLGAKVLANDNVLYIESNFDNANTQFKKIEIQVEESGLSLRLFTPICALLSLPVTINGKGSLLKRPIELFLDVLPQLDVMVKSKNGKLPLHILGSMKKKDITIDGELSSQFLTGFLFAYSYLAKKLTHNSYKTIAVKGLNSTPYIDVTIDVLKHFGLPIPVNHNYKEFTFKKMIDIEAANKPFKYNIEGDWSSAAFLLVAGAIAGQITVNNLNINSFQADKNIIDVLQQCEAKLVIKKNSVTVQQPQNVLKSFTYNAVNSPDLFPPLVALAACCNGVSKIIGVNRLLHKESNRAMTLQTEFAKLGVAIKIDGNAMLVTGTNCIKDATINSHNDHRIAMACAVVALRTSNKVIIEDADAVKKSYPNFFIDLQLLGAAIKKV